MVRAIHSGAALAAGSAHGCRELGPGSSLGQGDAGCGFRMRLPYRPVIREDEVKGFAGLQMRNVDVDILMYESDGRHG